MKKCELLEVWYRLFGPFMIPSRSWENAHCWHKLRRDDERRKAVVNEWYTEHDFTRVKSALTADVECCYCHKLTCKPALAGTYGPIGTEKETEWVNLFGYDD